MREVIEKVLGAEEEARIRLDAARKRAASIKLRADDAAATLVAAAREKATGDTKKLLDQVRSDSRSALELALEEESAGAKAFTDSIALASEDLADTIVRMISGQKA